MRETTTLRVGGLDQHVVVRGPPGAPVLLLVQAGPGFPLLHEAGALERALALEASHRVVYWDQRGCGRSVDDGEGPLSVARLVDDLVELTELLCGHLGVDALTVLGFSMGGTLAVLASERTARVARVVAVGPDVDLPGSEQAALDFALTEARQRGHRRALAQLTALGPPPHRAPAQFMTRVRWVTEFGGVYRGKGFFALLALTVWRLVSSGYYSPLQVVRALLGIGRTQARVLPGLTALAMPTEVRVPLTVLQGRLDVAAPAALAARWYEGLVAPAGKALVWLEGCAHTPHFEDPAATRAALHRALGAA